MSKIEADDDGICYIDSGGLWQHCLDGMVIQLAVGTIKCAAPAMTNILYSKDGEVWSFPVNGGESSTLLDTDAIDIIYSCANGGILAVIDIGGSLTLKCFREPGTEFTVIESGTVGMGMVDSDGCYLLAFTNDNIYRISLGAYAEKNSRPDDWLEEYEQFLYSTRY